MTTRLATSARIGGVPGLAALVAIALVAATALPSLSEPLVPLAAPEQAATLRLQLFRPNAGSWTPVPCGSPMANVGNVRAVGYSTVQAPTRIRVGYGVGVGQAEAWYATGSYSPPIGVESSVVDIVQDLIPGETVHNFRLSVPAYTSVTCTIIATGIPAITEGGKSPRLPAPEAVDAMSVDVADYRTGAPIPCSASAASGRLIFNVKASNDASMILHLHVHNETPSANGPDQDGDPANRRFWEGAFNHLFVPAGTSVVLNGVNGAQRGPNAFHFGQQAATTEAPTRVSPESVCTVTNTD